MRPLFRGLTAAVVLFAACESPDIDIDVGTGLDTEADTELGTEADTEADTELDTEADTDGCLEPQVYYPDADEDGFGVLGLEVVSCDEPVGYVTLAGDCDDDNDALHPDADELCDEVDNNCNGVADEDAVDQITVYLDADQDGFGDVNRFHLACEPSELYVTSDADCNDLDASVYPGAPELCDGLDNACVGELPEDEADLDVDGVLACEGDCDDERNDVGPGVRELCDGSDNDCDGFVDEGDALDLVTYYYDRDGDGYGGTLSQQACNAPDASWVDVGNDCNDNHPDYNVDCEVVCEICPDDSPCISGEYCESGVCDEGECQPAVCDDGVKNGFETDIDCGGSVCEPCDLQLACVVNDDCVSASCNDNVCSCTARNYCADDNPCTDDSCNTTTHECENVPNDGNSCEDDLLCTDLSVCHQGECRSQERECVDNRSCTVDWCDPETGSCEFEPVDGWVEGPYVEGVSVTTACNLLDVGEFGYDGINVFQVFEWPGMTGQGTPAGWQTVNHCTSRPKYNPNAMGYWPSVLQKVCGSD